MTGFAERLVAARTLRDIPAGVLADRAGLAPSQLSIYENAVSQPGLANLVKIADALDVDADYLIGRTSRPISRSEATTGLLARISALSEHDTRLLELFLATLEATAHGEDLNADLRLRARIEAVRRQQRATN